MSDLIERQKAIEALLKEFERDTPKAIRAKLTLENLPSAQPEKRTEKHTETHACDLISRQTAIDALHGYFDGMLETDTWSPCDVYGLIEILPSVQPETHDKRTKTHSCDCISRQDAIEAIAQCTCCGNEDTLRAYVLKHTLDNGWCGGILEALDAVKDLPSAQPDLSEYSDKLWRNAYERGKAEAQRKNGMWIEHNPHKWGLGIVFECSKCGEKIDCEPSNFCPNCGADMREPEDIPMEYFESGGR